MGFTFGQRYVVVNIPAAVAEAVEDGKVARRYVTVVGKVDRPSPTLTTKITAVNFNPTWTVPLSILKKDIVTKMRKDPGYVGRMKMRVLDARRQRGRCARGRLAVRPHAELHGAAGFGRRQCARQCAHRHAEPAFGLHARHQPQGILQRGLSLPVVGLHARARRARSRGVDSGGQAGLEPQGDRRRDRDRQAHHGAARARPFRWRGSTSPAGRARTARSTSATTCTISIRSRRTSSWSMSGGRCG